MAFRAVIFTSTSFRNVQFARLGMTAFVFQTYHTLACLGEGDISIAYTKRTMVYKRETVAT